MIKSFIMCDSKKDSTNKNQTNTLATITSVFCSVSYILDKYKIEHCKIDSIKECTTVTELLDVMLDPICVMYLKHDINNVSFDKSSERYLAYIDKEYAQSLHLLDANNCEFDSKFDGLDIYKNNSESGLSEFSTVADNADKYVPVVLEPALVGYKITNPKNNLHIKMRKKDKQYFKCDIFEICRPLQGENFEIKNIVKLIVNFLTIRDVWPIAFLILLITLLGLVVPALYKYILYSIVPMGKNDTAMQLLTSMGLLYLGCGATRALLSVYKTFKLNNLKLRINAYSQNAIMSRVLLMDNTYFANTSAGKLSTNLFYSQQLAERILNVLVDGTLTTVFSIIYIPQMAALGPSLWVPALVCIIIQTLVYIYIVHIKVDYENKRVGAYTKTNNFSFIILKAISKIKTSGAKNRILNRWFSLYSELVEYSSNPPTLVKLDAVINSALSGLTTLIVLIVAVFTGVDKASYIAFTSSMYLVSSAFYAFNSTYGSVCSMSPMFRRVKDVMRVKKKKYTYSQKFIHKLNGRVEVVDLNFTYPGCSTKCLENISFSIKPGEKIAIVGESGCGKSTLINLLLGLEKYDSGKIIYDGIDIENINLRSLRRNIGSVLQNSKVFPGSVRNNILYSLDLSEDYDTNMYDNIVWSAACDACLDEYLSSCPKGLDTRISETECGGFSGGQKQRVLIARALVSKPGLLIFDEATSALDNITQSKVYKNIYTKKCSAIIVAHRLSTVINCDRIYVIDKGKICETGTYKELIYADGKFADLVYTQFDADLL